jgi:hypothetical protein
MISVWAIGIVLLSGCLKDDDYEGYQVSAVRALNAVPGSESLDIGLDQNQLNFDNYTGLVEAFAYGDTLVYKNAWPGNRLVRVFEEARSWSGPPLAKKNVTFLPGKFYSLYVAGKEDDIDVIYTEDDLTAPDEGQAKLRFIHLSPDAPSLDMGIEGMDTLLATDKAFAEVSEFVSIPTQLHAFRVMRHGSDEMLHRFEFEPKNGMIYTIWAKGLLENGTDETKAFGHGVITH